MSARLAILVIDLTRAIVSNEVALDLEGDELPEEALCDLAVALVGPCERARSRPFRTEGGGYSVSRACPTVAALVADTIAAADKVGKDHGVAIEVTTRYPRGDLDPSFAPVDGVVDIREALAARWGRR